MRLHLFVAACTCISVGLLSSCKKQVNEEQSESALLSTMTSSSNCRVVGLGQLIPDNNGSTIWKNILLKWYDNSGKLKNVKFHLDWFGTYSSFGDDLNLDYGEVIYAGDEIKVKEVFTGIEILRIKLDVMNRPVTTWYYNPNTTSGYGWPVDTSYYYYDVSNRLETLVQHKTSIGSPNPPLILTWKFIYDPVGNLVLIKLGENPYGGFEFRYDYSNLNKGMATLNLFTAPTKMLEFMDLLKFEQHHQLREVIWYIPSGSIVAHWTYNNITRDSEGKDLTYALPPTPYKQFIAWDCGASQMIQSKNPTQEEFMKLIRP